MTQANVSGATIDDYCFWTMDAEKLLSTSKEEKEQIVRQRVDNLNKNEGQRWVPLIGAYRLVKDTINEDMRILTAIRSTRYNVANIIYTIMTSVGIGYGAAALSNLLR